MTTLAPLGCTILEWDSSFWNKTIGRGILPAKQADDCAQALGLDCLYLLIPIHEMSEAHEAVLLGFQLTDVRVQFEIEPRNEPSLARWHVDEDVPALAEIARTSFRRTRFYNDPHFPNERCHDLYETWTRNSCAGEASVLVVGDPGKPLGFVTLTDDGEVGLIAVRQDSRQQGVGAELMDGALAWAHARGFDSLTVVTQGGNLPAQRLFQRCGFRTKTVGLWFHKWL